MLAKDENTPGLRAIVMPLLLAGCAALGWWVGHSTAPEGPPVDTTEAGPFADDPGLPANSAGLDVVYLDFSDKNVEKLKAARRRSMDRGQIVQSAADVVPAVVRLGDRECKADVRLKGDMTDHIKTDKWSLRIELKDGVLNGMSRFSIQHPRTRNDVMEWLIMRTARKIEDVLAPRSTLVHVVVNGRGSGVYYLEEHFTKELLESQGRRDGPIIRFREDALWSAWLQWDVHQASQGVVPPPAQAAQELTTAEIGAFDENRLARIDALNRRLQSAIQHMRQLQRMAVAAPGDAVARRAVDQFQGRTLDDLMVAGKVGRWLALHSLFFAQHGLPWHQLRFYYDAPSDKLEPICFDTGATIFGAGGVVDHLPFLPRAEFDKSPACYEATFRAVGRMTAPGYVDELMRQARPELLRFYHGLAAEIAEGRGEELAVPAGTFAAAADHTADVLRMRAARLRKLAIPEDPVNFSCQIVPATVGGGPGNGSGHDKDALIVEVEAWTTTWAPVLVTGFRFSNGRVEPATAHLPPGHEIYRRDGAVILPPRGAPLKFRFPVDKRLASLRDIASVKKAVQSGGRVGGKIRLDVLFRPVAGDEETAERLRVRRFSGAPDGRPRAPTLLEALETHSCLGYDRATDRLFVREGEWDVAGDLLVPTGHTLHASAGTTLRFAAGAVLLSGSPVQFTGTAARPVVLEPEPDTTKGWSGLMVVDAPRRSELTHVRVRGAAAVDRGGWQATGGVTFYRSDVHLRHVRVDGALGEDALNVVAATDFLMEDCELSGGASDLFDGDFVRGAVRRCKFSASGEDAFDVSGSKVTVEDCEFTKIGDKAFSVGEKSTVTLARCTVHDAAIGLACKDLSQVEATDLDLRALVHYGIAVFVKKPEYGPASVAATNLSIGKAGRGAHLVQTGCKLTVDGTEIPAEEVDVADLYRRKILGK